MAKKNYSKFEYLEAKQIVNGAEVVRRYNSPTVCNTTYRTADGNFWYEHESKLEAPEDDYSLSLVEAA